MSSNYNYNTLTNQVMLILEDGNRAGTHRFAFLKSIVDDVIANPVDRGADVNIPLINLALRHVEIYWKMFVRKTKQNTGGSLDYYADFSKLAQSLRVPTGPKAEHGLYDLMQKLATEDNLPKPALTAINTIRKKIITGAAADALKIPGALVDFYSFAKNVKPLKGKSLAELTFNENDYITIHKKHVDDLDKNKILLANTCTMFWAMKTDAYTGKTQTGLQLLDPPQPQGEHNAAKKYLAIYKKMGIKDCCYCKSTPKRAATVDHVFPWHYIGRNEFWNMLPTCKSCDDAKAKKILPLSQTNRGILKKYIEYILRNHKENFIEEIEFEASISNLPLHTVCDPQYLLYLTVKRCRGV